MTDWESRFGSWAQPPSDTEQNRCENAVKAIRNAISQSAALKSRGVRVFVQGSYRNRVNVRRESDVDVGVMAYDQFLAEYPAGKGHEDFGNFSAPYSFGSFKNDLETALVSYFGRRAVVRGDKAFDVRETSYHVEADVAPFFEFREYNNSGLLRCGVAMDTDKGRRVLNFPERLRDDWPSTPLHYENGVAKNTATSLSFKGVVRVLKSLRNELDEAGQAVAAPVPGFLLESLAWNAPNSCFTQITWTDNVRETLYYLWSNTRSDAACKEWTEVNGIKYLFHNSQPWTRGQAHAFINEAWDYLGLPRE